MGIPFWKSIIFFIVVAALAVALFPSQREIGRLYSLSGSMDQALSYLERQFNLDPADLFNSLRYLDILNYYGQDERFIKASSRVLSLYPDNLAALEIVSKFYVNEMDYDNASVYWMKMLKVKPELKDTMYSLISYYLLVKKYDQLIPLYEMEMGANQLDLESYYSLGRLYALEGRKNEAKALYENMLVKFPKEGKVRVYLAEIYEVEGNTNKAIELYAQATAIDPKNEDFSLRYLDTLIYYNRASEAAAVLDKFAEAFSHRPGFLKVIADFYVRVGEKKKARAMLESIYKKNPQGYDVLKSLGELCLDLNDFAKAQDYLTLYIDKTGGDYRSYEVLGDVLSAMGDTAAGKNDYIKALSLLRRGAVNKLEEGWLLWKLDRKQEAATIILPLATKSPDNSDIAYLAALIYLDRLETEKAAHLIEFLGRSTGKGRSYKELLARLLVLKGKWVEAFNIYSELAKGYPNSLDYHRSCADMLYLMKRWPEAKIAYEEVLAVKKPNPDLLWDYRQALKEGSNAFSTDASYLFGPQSLRQYYIHQDITGWVNPRTRVTARAIEEIHVKQALGNTPAINDTLAGHKLMGEWFFNEAMTLTGEWESVYHKQHMFNETAIGLSVDRPKYHGTIDYRYNHLVRDPIQGIDQEAVIDTFRMLNDFTVSRWLSLGHISELEWYRVSPEANFMNGKEYLGHKWKNDMYLNIPFWRKPYVSFNFHYKITHWQKSFSDADEVIDFIGDERIYYGGFYLEQRFGTLASVNVGITRAYDAKRKFYYTISNANADIWLRKNTVLTLSWEYGRHVESLIGTGNSQLLTAKLKVLF